MRPVRPEDEPARRSLGWHEEIERNYGRTRRSGSTTQQEARDWLQAIVTAASPTFWAIEVDGRLAGTASLYGRHEQDRRARFAIGMMSPGFVGRGLGTEATRLVLSHAFDVLDLHRVDLRVLAFNRAARACYRRCGFVEEGVERETCWLDGAWHDDVIMGILADEFAAAGRAPGQPMTRPTPLNRSPYQGP